MEERWIIFFCDAKDEEKVTVSSVFRNPLMQMIETEFAVQDLMNEECRKSGQARISSSDKKYGTFSWPLLKDAKKITIVIDGLDELD